MTSKLSTRQVRSEYRDFRCNRNHELAEITILGRHPVRIMTEWVDAWKALEATLRHAGYPQAEIVGSYNCRKIAGIAALSLHSYKAAIDIDPRRNGRTFRRDWQTRSLITPQQVAAVEALRSGDGKYQLFVSGIHFVHKDPMHFQIAAPKRAIRTGIAGDTIATHHHHEAHTTTHHTTDHQHQEANVKLPTIRKGDRGQPVKNLQGLLDAHGEHLSIDGDAGSGTDRAIRRFQTAHKLTADGIAGPNTWTALLT